MLVNDAQAILSLFKLCKNFILDHLINWTETSNIFLLVFYLCKTGTLLDLQLVNLDLVKFKDHPRTYINKEEEVSRV